MDIESAFGVRYSELFQLPYFDPIRHHVIDPMHNLLLGTAKHTFKVLVEKNLIDEEKFAKIEQLMEGICKVKEVGRVAKSMRYHKSLKAEEWKNWVLIFSLFCLKDILPKRIFNMWQIFVRACKLLVQTSISRQEIEDAHRLLLLYCVKFQEIFGSECCTPNMHMHLHLKECLLDYGPVYAFWAFSFERHNGKLGSFHTNNRSVTISMMKKFLHGVKTISQYQQIECEDLPNLAEFNLIDEKQEATNAARECIRRKDILSDNDLLQVLYSIISVPKMDSFDAADSQDVMELFQKAFPTMEVVHFPRFFKSYDSILFGRETICTKKHRGGSSKDFFIMARYDFENQKDVRPGEVIKIFSINVEVLVQGRVDSKEIVFLEVDFYEQHPMRYLHGE